MGDEKVKKVSKKKRDKIICSL